jgi:hypothetical protein
MALCIGLGQVKARKSYVAGDLLGEHVVVTFPGCGWEVVCIPGADAA